MKRYALMVKRASERIATMHEHVRGEWVRFEDYAKLKAENDTLGEANKWLTYGIGSWCAKADKAEERAKAAEDAPDAPTREKLKEAVELIRRMAEVEWDGPCRLDHHGYCQEHGDFDEGECYVPVTKRFVEEVESENQI